ncbi:MAG: PIG-L family deacetylase [Clostridia bacterium]|nr:PIG-L family deacetylase [Clostridia bacterium]
MKEKAMRILSIGAHPDDADTSAGGLLMKLCRKGWEVRLLSVTDGSAGTYKPELAGAPLAAIRRAEAARSGAIFGGRYDVMDHPDGRLEPTLAVREELIRYIRAFSPDVIITNRLNDYHADHRYTAQLVQDASYLLTVPAICPDTPSMEHMPVVLFWHDSFQKPYPFRPDVIVPIDDTMESIVQAASCHECQYFDWLCWPDNMERTKWPREKQIAHLRERFERMFANHRKQYDALVREKFGDAAETIGHIETFEISEYGEEPSAELMTIFER